MNMNHYQKFIERYNTASTDKNWSVWEAIAREKLPELREKYKLIYGITDDELIVAMEIRGNKKVERELSVYLNTCHVFEVDDRHKYLLLLTRVPEKDNSKLWEQVKLPFPEVFLDVGFGPEDDDRLSEQIDGILIKELHDIEPFAEPDSKTIKPKIMYGLMCYISGTNNQGNFFIDSIKIPLVLKYKDNVSSNFEVNYDDRKLTLFLKDFIVNFLLFLREREVEWVVRQRNDSGNTRRIKEHKMPLPSSNFIRLTGTLKKYVDSLSEENMRGKLSYQFWVMGHWRTLKSERYVHKKGLVQFIAPFLKGEGILIKKSYKVLPKEEEGTVHYEDIKALDKPLLQMTQKQKSKAMRKFK